MTRRPENGNGGGGTGKPLSPATRLVTAGPRPEGPARLREYADLSRFDGALPERAGLLQRKARYTYGTKGTPTTESLETAWSEISRRGRHRAARDRGSRRFRSRCSRSCDRATTCWSRTRSTVRRGICATRCCKRFGVETTYYDPLVGARDRAAVQAEHPRGVHRGAGLAVVRDAGYSGDRRGRACARRDRDDGQHLGDAAVLPAACARRRCRDRGRHEISQRPFGPAARHGLGERALLEGAARGVRLHGFCAGPEDVFLGLRGLRSMRVRLMHHQQAALAVARWLAARPEVARVLHPALETDPGHAIWKRDFSGASGLFGVVFKPMPDARRARLPQCADPVRHRRVVGRLREPRDPVRLRGVPHRDEMEPGRAVRFASTSGSRMWAT